MILEGVLACMAMGLSGALMSPCLADGQEDAEYQESFDALFGQYGYSIESPPTREDLLALGWTDARIEYAELRLTDPDRAAEYQKHFDTLFGQYGFSIESPPTYEDLLALGWTDARIEYEDHILASILNGNSETVWYYMWNGANCPGAYTAVVTEQVAILMCRNGSAASWSNRIKWFGGRVPNASSCNPCSYLTEPQDQEDDSEEEEREKAIK